MSSYLVAFVCAEMEHIEKKSDLVLERFQFASVSYG